MNIEKYKHTCTHTYKKEKIEKNKMIGKIHLKLQDRLRVLSEDLKKKVKNDFF